MYTLHTFIQIFCVIICFVVNNIHTSAAYLITIGSSGSGRSGGSRQTLQRTEDRTLRLRFWSIHSLME